MFGHTVNNSKSGGTLRPIHVETASGSDVHGTFIERVIDWSAPTWPQDDDDDKKVYFQTSIKQYNTKLVRTDARNNITVYAAIFTQRYPQGVVDCANLDDNIGKEKEDSFSSSYNGDNSSMLRSTYPTLKFGHAMHYFSYHGGFLEQHSVGQFPTTNDSAIKDGLEAGPLLLFQHTDDKDDQLEWCGIVSHYNEFMTLSTQHTPGTSTVSYGPMDSICPVPAGYEAKTILVLHQGPSIHTAVEAWGTMLLGEHMGTQRRTHDVDHTTRYLGYSTDNGAYYYYQKEEDRPVTSNMEETMIAVHNYSQAADIPYRYWLLDSWWYYQSTTGKTRGVTNWTARPDVFPHGMQYLYSETGMFVQAHNRMWSRENVYTKNYEFIPSETGNVSLPTEYRFWNDIFQLTTAWGMVVYEQDWLNVQFERQSQAFTNATLMRLWLMEMGRAAQDHHLAIQYCMPLARHILQSVEIPAVTQARASGDYQAGVWLQQWHIGTTSLLYKALDLRPSKDSAWSMPVQPNNRFENTTEPFPEFQAMIMAMSTGPVAFSDKIGHSNSTLILRTCRQDGVLLQPAQPLIPIHEWFYERTQKSPKWTGHIQESKMKVNGLPPYPIVMSVLLSDDFLLYPHHLSDFHASERQWLVYDPTIMSSKIRQSFSIDSPLLLPKSQTKTQGEYRVHFVAPVVNGWCLLGETKNKFVPLSSNRFVHVSTTSTQYLTLLMEGAYGESVEIAYATVEVDNNDNSNTTKEWAVRSRTVTIPASGRAQVTIKRPRSTLVATD